jgi:hypothetical protein
VAEEEAAEAAPRRGSIGGGGAGPLRSAVAPMRKRRSGGLGLGLEDFCLYMKLIDGLTSG